MTDRRLRINLTRIPAIEMTRRGLNKQPELCYLLVANKHIMYPNGWSRILYIGTTKNGISRVAESAASQVAEGTLDRHGVTDLHVHVVSCGAVPGLKRERLLEGALLMTFRDLYSTFPDGNTRGTGFTRQQIDEHFTAEGVRAVILNFGYTKQALTD